MPERQGVKVERVAEPDVERARQAELAPGADRQHAAVDEQDRRAARQVLANAAAISAMRATRSIVQRVAAAWPGTGTRRAGPLQRRDDAALGVVLRRVEHEVADEARGMTRDGAGDRVLVAGHAGDERGARDALLVELVPPAVRERLGRDRVVPVEMANGIDRRHLSLRGQGPEEPRREEVDVGVADHGAILGAWSRPTERAHTTVSTIPATMRPSDRPHQSPRAPSPARKQSQ